ncbi:unnamed protein product [Prorocentrum cordatum]|uniref:EF-hand domain-containing protein n=1 Tax=Prorocentrum cordatum TaxID=2364126 RepID=A0ABN9SX84_9DINO|nr:unnamed protein product [Polarella glacialis]
MNHPRTFRIFNQRFGLQKHQTAMVFSAFDVDGDNTISLKEFLETCSFLMQVVKDGQVITNWRQKELRTLKETWPNQPQPVGSIRHNASEPSLATAVMAPAWGGTGRGAPSAAPSSSRAQLHGAR